MTPDPDLGKPAATSRRRPASWLLAAAVALASVGLSFGLIAATGSSATGPDAAGPSERPPSATQTPTAEPTPTATAEAGERELPSEAVEEVLETFLDGVAAATAAPKAGLGPLSGLATGAILEELEVEQQQLTDNGWSRAGAEKVVSVEVISAELDATPPTATVSACIDSNDITLLDAAGKPIVSGTTEKRSI